MDSIKSLFSFFYLSKSGFTFKDGKNLAYISHNVIIKNPRMFSVKGGKEEYEYKRGWRNNF